MRMGHGLLVLIAACSGASLLACGAHTPSPTPPKAARAAEAPRPDLIAIGESQSSSPVALARYGSSRVALVADEDDSVLHVVDLETLRELSTIELPGTPAHVVVGAAGKAYVTLRDKNAVAVLETEGGAPGALRVVAAWPTPAEPISLAYAKGTNRLHVACGWGRSVVSYRIPTGERVRTVPVDREPRQIVVADDEREGYVSHAVGGKVSVVELSDAPNRAAGPVAIISTAQQGKPDEASDESAKPLIRPLPAIASNRGAKSIAAPSVMRGTDKPRMGCQGFVLAKTTEPPGRLLAPQVLVDSGDAEVNTGGYGSANGMPAEVTSVAVIDLQTRKPLDGSLRVRAQPRAGVQSGECLLPRSAATLAKSQSLFVACLGADAIVEYDAAALEPHEAERRRWQVPSGPTGIAVDAERSALVVWSQFDRVLSLIPLESAAIAADAVTPPPQLVRAALSRKAGPMETADAGLGRKLFHAAGDRRISNDGRACASCHPDGRDDALTWSTPEGPRNTPMLAGRLADTAPFGWNGNGETVQEHLSQTFRRLGGRGLRGQEMDALLAYLGRMKAPAASESERHLGAERTAAIARGKELFHSSTTECASCHTGASTTDGKTHDIGAKAAADTRGALDTPSLRFVGGTAPYFHDGRYATLRDVLTARDHAMGQTRELSPADVDALEAYLSTL